jgi:hypothetical protein
MSDDLPLRYLRKPAPRRKNKGATDWETFRHEVIYPIWWYEWITEHQEKGNTAMLSCDECAHEEGLTLLARPNEWGTFWYWEDTALHAHHDRERDRHPGDKYHLGTIRRLCNRCHDALHKRREKEGYHDEEAD